MGENRKINIIIGADIVPTKSNCELFNKGDIETLVGKKIFGILKNADYTIFNLEVPLVDKINPIYKFGPTLNATRSTINGLKLVNNIFFSLANNHILDQGEEGLKSTINVLKENEIDFAGAGMNLWEASTRFYKKIGDLKLGIYCCAEHEFSIAGEHSAGANPFDPLDSLDSISEMKKESDYLIVLYHGGKEHYRYPSPYLQKVCHRIIEKGADIVVCQHSHCIGCEEIWKDKHIIYGQGNFLFDRSNDEGWRTSLLIKLSLDVENKTKKVLSTIEYIPLVKKGNSVRLAQGSAAENILSKFMSRSNDIKDERKVLELYKKLADEQKLEYLNLLSGKATKLFYRLINKVSGRKFMKIYLRVLYSKKDKIAITNLLECEAHRELLIELLKNDI